MHHVHIKNALNHSQNFSTVRFVLMKLVCNFSGAIQFCLVVCIHVLYELFQIFHYCIMPTVLCFVSEYSDELKS